MTDNAFIDVIATVVDVFQRAGIPYAVTGSVASGIHGEPVISQDVDFAIRMTVEQARQLDETLPQRFYRSTESLQEAARAAGMANLIDTDTSLKVDLSVLPRAPFFDAVLTRRVLEKYGPQGPSFYTVTAEDVILMKLEWRKDTRSQKQWENALSVARVKGAALDWKYLFEQARVLGVEQDLIALRDEAGI